MNNTTFGDESCGYYETVAGGAGAVSLFPYHNASQPIDIRCRSTDVVLNFSCFSGSKLGWKERCSHPHD